MNTTESRVGIYKPELEMTAEAIDLELEEQISVGILGSGTPGGFERGRKYYELSNHLGNVLVTISDKKIQVDEKEDGEVDWYEPYVVNAQDYYPGGMLMPERSYTSGNNYRYGFNGKEMDNEVKGQGAQYDYGFRIYDPRIMRFLSVDPLFKSYPWYTPYQFAGNMPIWAVDLDGLEEKVVTNWITIGLDGKTTIRTSTTDYKDYGGGVGPLGKGTLVTYSVDRRQAVSNPDYKKNGLAKTLNLPGPIESYSVFTPAPDADKATRKRGGLWFTSKEGSGNGGGPAGELAPGDGEPINIDLLLSAAGGTGLMEDFSRGGKGLERLIGILENMGKIAEGVETGIELKDGVNEYLEKKAAELPDPNVAHCKACGKNYVIENGKATWTESAKQAGDTTESHGDPLKASKKQHPQQ